MNDDNDPDGATLEDFLAEIGVRDEVYHAALFKLTELLAQMRDEYRHPEVDFGKPEGREIW